MKHHLHLPECPSTQTLLKEKIEANESVHLISTSRQTEGMGRRSNRWAHSDNALAFSLAIEPHGRPSLTPLEVASILVKYFREEGHHLRLKWPNDLINAQGQKCGGILCTFLSEKAIIVGIGINYGRSSFEGIHNPIIPPGSVDEQRVLSEQDKERIPLAIYQYLLNHRMPSEQILQTWKKYCYHQGAKVRIIDEETEISGFFQGVTVNGEAIIESHGKQTHIPAGSLTVIR